MKPIVKHLTDEVQDQLSILLDYACDVYYYQFKRCAKEWAEERHKFFIDPGEPVGNMPLEGEDGWYVCVCFGRGFGVWGGL